MLKAKPAIGQGIAIVLHNQDVIGNMPMIIQNQDGSLIKEPEHSTNNRQSYYAVVPAYVVDGENTVIDELISFAFDTLGAWSLDVRVYDETATKALGRGGASRDGDLSMIDR